MDKEMVLELLCQGADNRTIAYWTRSSVRQVKRTLGELFQEYDAKNRMHLVAQYIRSEKVHSGTSA